MERQVTGGRTANYWRNLVNNQPAQLTSILHNPGKVPSELGIPGEGGSGERCTTLHPPPPLHRGLRGSAFRSRRSGRKVTVWGWSAAMGAAGP